MVLDATGWIGGVVVILAYMLVSTGRIDAEGPWFQWLNIAGGLLLTGTAVYRRAVPNTVTNLVWIGLAFYALAAAHRRHRIAAAASLPASLPESIPEPLPESARQPMLESVPGPLPDPPVPGRAEADERAMAVR